MPPQNLKLRLQNKSDPNKSPKGKKNKTKSKKKKQKPLFLLSLSLSRSLEEGRSATMEAMLVDCVRNSLSHFVYKNAIFMCERLCAEFPSEVTSSFHSLLYGFCKSKLLLISKYTDSVLFQLGGYFWVSNVNCASLSSSRSILGFLAFNPLKFFEIYTSVY